MQAAIGPVFGQKGIVATLFGDAVLGDDNDAVGIADGGKAMGNDQGRAPLCQFIKRLLDGAFCFGIKGRSCFVQDQDRRVFKENPRNRDALFLTAGKLDPAFTNNGINPVSGSQSDHPVAPGVPHRRFHHRWLSGGHRRYFRAGFRQTGRRPVARCRSVDAGISW